MDQFTDSESFDFTVQSLLLAHCQARGIGKHFAHAWGISRNQEQTKMATVLERRSFELRLITRAKERWRVRRDCSGDRGSGEALPGRVMSLYACCHVSVCFLLFHASVQL